MKRTRFTRTSVAVVRYLNEKGLIQSRIAELLSVDRSFVSRVASGERELSVDQLEHLASHLGVELGVMLLDATQPAKPPRDPKRAELIEMCREFVREATALRRELLATKPKRASV